MKQYHIWTVTHEPLYSPVHDLILPDVSKQTLREATELKCDYLFYGDHTVQFLDSRSLHNARHIAKTAPITGCSEYKVTNGFKVKVSD